MCDTAMAIWPGSANRNESEERQAGDFGKAVSELTLVHERIVAEHTLKATKLHRANELLARQVSDLQWRIEEMTRFDELAHLAIIPEERNPWKTSRDYYLTEASNETGSSSASGAAAMISHANLDMADKVGALDAHMVMLPSADANSQSEEAKERDSVRFLESEESDKSEKSDRGENREKSGKDENNRFTRKSTCNWEVGAVFDGSSSCMTKDLNETKEEKAARRAQRLRTVLQARLRPAWSLDEEMDVLVPRWSLVSAASIDTERMDSFAVWNITSLRSVPRNSSNSGEVSNESWGIPAGSTRTQRMCVIHPQSRIKVCVDLFGICMMAYDFIATPLMFFNLEESVFQQVMGWMTKIFWTVDLWLNFHTAIFLKGALVVRLDKIARNYLKTMFFLDFSIVLGEWLSYVLERTQTNAKELENMYLLRILKGLRFLKVLRVFKFERILQELKAQSNSIILLLWLRPLVLVSGLLVFNHTLACIWYGIGSQASNGWPHQVQDSSFAYVYATSLHWSISQLHGNMEVFPQTVQERVFMCSTAIVALILYSTFLSSITNDMMQIRSLQAKRQERKNNLRAVLSRRNVSVKLGMLIKKRCDYMINAKAELDSEQAILENIPKDLLTDLYTESRRPAILRHPFFNILHARGPRIVRQLCHDSMTETSHLPEYQVFNSGDACHGMYFVLRGELLYEPVAQGLASRETVAPPSTDHQQSDQNDAVQASSIGLEAPSINLETRGEEVNRGQWLSEAALWCSWEHCGNLISRSSVLLLTVEELLFASVVKQFQFAHVNSKRYAKEFIERMVQHGVLTDIMPDDHPIVSMPS